MDWKRYYARRLRDVEESPVTANSSARGTARGDFLRRRVARSRYLPAGAMKEATDTIFEYEGREALQYGPNAGSTRLRDWIAQRMRQVEGLDVGREQILVTSGGLAAIDLVSKVLRDPGDYVLVEAPTPVI